MDCKSVFLQINLSRTFINQVCNSGLAKDHDKYFAQNYCLEFAFVQFCNVVQSQDIEIQKLNEHLNCLLLQWQRSSGESNILSSAKVFGVVPADSMRGLVHFVRSSEISGHGSPQNERCEAGRALSAHDEG